MLSKINTYCLSLFESSFCLSLNPWKILWRFYYSQDLHTGKIIGSVFSEQEDLLCIIKLSNTRALWKCWLIIRCKGYDTFMLTLIQVKLGIHSYKPVQETGHMLQHLVLNSECFWTLLVTLCWIQLMSIS